MNYNKKTVMDFDPKGKKVLLRCDFNVPQNKETGEITSDKRIVAALPTIKYLLENGAAVIACSHLGKPKGEWKESLSLAPVAKRLSELLGMDVIFAKDIIGEDAKAKAAALQPGQQPLVGILRKACRDAARQNEDIILVQAVQLLFQLLHGALRNVGARAVQLGLLPCLDLDIDAGHALFQMHKIGL